jgi:hypothetical protein
MRSKFITGSVFVLLIFTGLISLAASNLNLSKSNINRLVYPTDTVSQAQAAAILADLDSAMQSGARVNLQAAVGEALKKQGLDTKIKKTIIQPPSAAQPLTTVIILSNPADEAAALAVSDPGAEGSKPTKGKKTN